MSTLDDIVNHGNRQLKGPRKNNWIVCADGFKLSVIAGPGTYCTPRPGFMNLPLIGDVSEDYPGPYTEVEVGYPSERPEPWHCTAWKDGYDRHEDHPTCDGWQLRSDDFDGEDNWATVYGYVPVPVVRALIDSHGGEA